MADHRPVPGSFRDFWPYYVHEHRQKFNRVLHFCGTLLSLICVVFAGLNFEPWFLLAAVISGYSFAWVGHLLIEHNRPATWRAPFFSLLADYKMFGLMLIGQMGKEVERLRPKP